MERVPQIVSERLKAGAPVVDHPDADLLTAFAERSLSKSERATLVEHLARCGECREIVALALPASDDLQPTVSPSATGWLTWPVLRWGLIAAGILAVASFGVMQYQRRSSTMAFQASHPEAENKVAKNLPVAPPSSKPTEERDKAQSPAALAPSERREQAAASSGSVPAAPAPPPSISKKLQPNAGQLNGAVAHGPRVQWQQNTNNFQQQAPAQALSELDKQLRSPQLTANAPAPSNSQVAGASSSQLAADGEAPVLESQRLDQQPLAGGHADSKIQRIKPAGTSIMSASKTLARDVPAIGGPVGAPLKGYSPAFAGSPGVPTRWTINSVGGLQRSLDQGGTWQDVDVNNSPPAAGASFALEKAPARAKAVTTDDLAKKDAAVPLVFRAIASNGPDVWAGASGGLLYHSSDAGSHWTRIVPAASGVSLTGDIVSLEFIDPQHGRVVTSTPEVWTTSDAGQSWQKQ